MRSSFPSILAAVNQTQSKRSDSSSTSGGKSASSGSDRRTVTITNRQRNYTGQNEYVTKRKKLFEVWTRNSLKDWNTKGIKGQLDKDIICCFRCLKFGYRDHHITNGCPYEVVQPDFNSTMPLYPYPVLDEDKRKLFIDGERTYKQFLLDHDGQSPKDRHRSCKSSDSRRFSSSTRETNSSSKDFQQGRL